MIKPNEGFITHTVICPLPESRLNDTFCLEKLGRIAAYSLTQCGYTNIFDASECADGLGEFLTDSQRILYINPLCPDLKDRDISLFMLKIGADEGCLASQSGEIIAAVTRLKPSDECTAIERIAEQIEGERVCCDSEIIANRWQLTKRADAFMQAQLERLCVEKNALIISDNAIVISPYAEIGVGVTIYPNVQIHSGSVIGGNCVLMASTVISNSVIGNGCTINACQIYNSTLEEDVRIGPFCHVRPNSYICKGARIGDFVEVKNSRIGEDTHISHLTYVGDSDVGKRVNFGCGTVTVNYDGTKKARTTIEDDAFIGCNTNLVAPVKIGEGAFTAAGSTITADVPPYALAISRTKDMRIIDEWNRGRK